MPATFTRQQIESIDVGTMLQWSIDGVRFSAATPVVEILTRREDIHGKLFVHGYRKFGDHGGRMSFAIKEGDVADARLYRIEE